MYQSIIFGTVLVMILAVYFIFKRLKIEKFTMFLKAVTIVFMVVGFFRFFLSDSFINIINDNSKGYEVNALQVVLRWGYYLNYVILPMSVFFDSRIFKNIASYFCLPFTILTVIFFNDFMVFFLDSAGRGIHLTQGFRYFYFVLELILALFIPIITQIKYKHVFDVKNKKEWANFFICLLAIIIQMIPVYVPQHLIGYGSVTAKSYTPFHFVWMGIIIIEIFVLYRIFSYKSFKDRYMLCVFFVLVLFFHYNSLYLMGITIPRLPIQLCNIAAFLYVICIPLRLNKMFNFCFICNIVGTIIAIVTPDFSAGAFSFWNVHYMLEHTLVLIVPSLCMGLRIFPRVNKKSLKHMLIGFSCYFMFCLISGTILNGYSDVTKVEVNYFFLFDMDKLYNWLPFLKFTEEVYIEMGRFIIYPVFVLLIYLGFLFLCLLFYWLVVKLYDYVDDHYELRKSRIDLYEKITGKKSKAPVDYID